MQPRPHTQSPAGKPRGDDADRAIAADDAAEAGSSFDAGCDDQVLLAAIIAADTDTPDGPGHGDLAVAELVRRYQSSLQVYAWRLTGDRQLAEDLVQEVFVTLLTELERLMPIRYLRALLFRMTTNRCLNARRSRTRRREVSLEVNSGRPGETSMAIGSVLATEERPVSAQLDHSELTDLVLDALDELPGRQRSAWVLKVLEHRPYSEIAEILDTTVGNCEVLVHRAARRMSVNRALQKFISPG
ncbi:MAG: RNA polymerase sigma factor [Planctomycetota bacterium]